MIVLIPLTIYFWGYLLINSKKFKTPQNQSFWIIVSLLLIFDLLSTALLSTTTLIFSSSLPGKIISLFYFPYPLYFFLTIFHWYQKLQQSNVVVKKTAKIETLQEIKSNLTIDNDRRRFLKILAGTGVSVFLLSLLNPKQAGAAFFGSVPGPGTVSVKDSLGNKINPSEKQPTDGYKISKIDDSSSTVYAYYGFVDQGGQWYVQRETLSGVDTGSYQYFKGSNNFSSNWTSRASLSYGDFNDIF